MLGLQYLATATPAPTATATASGLVAGESTLGIGKQMKDVKEKQMHCVLHEYLTERRLSAGLKDYSCDDVARNRNNKNNNNFRFADEKSNGTNLPLLKLQDSLSLSLSSGK